ncbi:VCBS repeat-containing protein [bacterium]|nr:VCBS repeat-containing protein [bacterium]
MRPGLKAATVLTMVLFLTQLLRASDRQMRTDKAHQTILERYNIETSAENQPSRSSDKIRLLDYGGPDSHGYTWSDSDEPDGPAYEWIEISGTGTQVFGLADDNYRGPYPIGFGFPFYDNSYTQFYIQSNGVINFINQYFSYSNQYVPLADSYNNCIAWFWDDLHPRSGSVYYQTVNNKLVIQFVNYGQYYTSGRINAEVILYPDGMIRIQYKDIQNGFYVGSSTIGIENQSGTDGLNVAYFSAYVHNVLALQFEPAGGEPNLYLQEPNQDNLIFHSGADVPIRWWSPGNIGGEVKIELMTGNAVAQLLTASTPDDGWYDRWTVGTDLPSSTEYRIRISAVHMPAITRTGRPFTIIAPDTLFSIMENHVTGTDLHASMGCAWGDLNRDGFDDLFVANDNNEPNDLFINHGGGVFTRVTQDPVVTDPGSSLGGCWADYDNDGFPDLYVVNQNEVPNRLYRNQGDGTFLKITEGNLVTDIGFSQNAAWGDYDNDGFVDLFVVNVGEQNNCLYHNNGDGTFTKITEGPVVNDGGNSVSCAWIDIDLDGDQDIFVANKGGKENYLYMNGGNGQFTRIDQDVVATDAGETWSSSWADYDLDGDFDLFTANNSEPNALYINGTAAGFTKLLTGFLTKGIQRSRSSCWADVNNDGYPDLYVTNRNEPSYLYYSRMPSDFQAYFTHTANSRGIAFSDMDHDGDLDLFVANDGENNMLYENRSSAAGSWLQVQCEGTVSNRSAIGARISVRAVLNGESRWQVREISSQTGFGSGNSLTVHFGLPGAAVVDEMRIEWPGGIVWDTTNVAVSQRLTVVERVPNHPPVAVNDTISITQDDAVVVQVLNNDADPDGDRLVIQSIDTTGIPGHADIDPGDTTLTYRPDLQFAGDVRFDYVISDGRGGLDTAMVVITVLDVNHPPVAADDSVTVSQNSIFVITALDNDTDPDGDSLVILSVDTMGFAGSVGIDPGNMTLTFIPDTGFTGLMQFDYVISDGRGLLDTASVFITVMPAASVKTLIPLSSVLYQNHPNPFNPTTTIRYDLPRDSRVRVTVYDIVGREVADIVDENQSAGTYQTVWSGCDRTGRAVPSGVYFYRIEAGEFVRVRKMVLVR